MQVIYVKDKWDEYTIEADDLDTAALGLLKERVDQGFWYDGEDAKTAKWILKVQDGKEAWNFLQDRSMFEYEYVELQTVKSYG